MGSISYAIDRTANPKEEVLEYFRSSLPVDAEILDHSFGAGSRYRGSWSWGGVLYAAVRSREGSVSMFVTLYRVDNVDGGRYIAIKQEHEDVGSIFYEPAQRLMKLLTPIDSATAIDWRKRVRDGYAFRRAQRVKARQAVGRTIKLESPLRYGPPVGRIDTVEVIDATRWRDPATGLTVRPAGRWQTLPFDIVSTTDQANL